MRSAHFRNPRNLCVICGHMVGEISDRAGRQRVVCSRQTCKNEHKNDLKKASRKRKAKAGTA